MLSCQTTFTHNSPIELTFGTLDHSLTCEWLILFQSCFYQIQLISFNCSILCLWSRIYIFLIQEIWNVGIKIKLGRYEVQCVSCNSIWNYDFKSIREKKKLCWKTSKSQNGGDPNKPIWSFEVSDNYMLICGA